MWPNLTSSLYTTVQTYHISIANCTRNSTTWLLYDRSADAGRITAIMPQDMPPAGGYEPVQYRRNLPARGFRPAYYLVAVAGIMTYGFWRLGKGIREQK